MAIKKLSKTIKLRADRSVTINRHIRDMLDWEIGDTLAITLDQDNRELRLRPITDNRESQ